MSVSSDTAGADLHGYTALVTGGAVGIGRSVALALAAQGANIALTHHSHPADEALAALAAEGVEAAAYRLDATVRPDVDKVVDAVADRFGRIDVLVNNAGGLIRRQAFVDLTDELWDAVLSLNLSSVVYATRAALRHMTGAAGRIVNVSSLAAQNGGGNGAAAYSTSKAAVIGLTRALAKELAPRGITVNAVAPGLILDTPFHETFTPPADQRSMISGIPVGHAGLPGDVAAVVAFLASPAARFVTGAVVPTNGGAYFG